MNEHKTIKDIKKWDTRIKEELGIDVQKYRNEAVVEDFVELLAFPKYVLTWMILPILIVIGIFLIGFFIVDLVHIEYLIYGILGLILFLVTGILIGLLFLTWKIKSDIWGVTDYSLEIMKSAVSDVNQVSNQITKGSRKDALGLLFKGIIHIVTIPMMSKVIAKKVPLFGRLVNSVVGKILILVAGRVKFPEENFKQEIKTKEDESKALQICLNSISSVSIGLETVINFTFGVVQFPLRIGFGIIVLILLLFLYLIN